MYTKEGTLDIDSILEEYTPVVRRLANQLVSRLPANVQLSDMIQAGMIGLVDASSRYDPAAGAKFETFATQRIRGAMLDELRSTDWAPRSARRSQREIEKAIVSVGQRLMRAPHEQEIADEMNIPIEQYHKMLTDSRGTQLFYQSELTASEGLSNAIEEYAEPESNSSAEVIQDEDFVNDLVDSIDQLPEREKLIVAMYYEQEMTLKEIGAVLGVTESRVSQLHSQAMSRLRGTLASWR